MKGRIKIVNKGIHTEIYINDNLITNVFEYSISQCVGKIPVCSLKMFNDSVNDSVNNSDDERILFEGECDIEDDKIIE